VIQENKNKKQLCYEKIHKIGLNQNKKDKKSDRKNWSLTTHTLGSWYWAISQSK
jgi:hypothetical protein